MSTREKLLERFIAQPNDFTFNELRLLMTSFGFQEVSKGRTSGSRVAFKHEVYPAILLHKPHPGNIVKRYALKQVYEYLKNNEII